MPTPETVWTEIAAALELAPIVTLTLYRPVAVLAGITPEPCSLPAASVVAVPIVTHFAVPALAQSETVPEADRAQLAPDTCRDFPAARALGLTFSVEGF